MTFPSNESLRNIDRLTRIVYCMLCNHKHLVIDIPEPRCPICNSIMVNVVKPLIEVQK